ncbi:hypothetical protein [Roseobacter sp. CCS2]|uniref:hypothetical protein n=1 Tax=Roseobacter sp. CCS2 TaxID=391593 RepID=UPI0000F3F580|nr:hypothetical protein [Roseobacter sp. CCS2]EBA10748.1 hypothetical protein RCCS2_11097 [Roseobacter sp. CCS2]
MHPPFYTVDHKIGPDIHHHSDTKPVTRRSLPERLSLRPSATGWPPVPLSSGAFIDNGALQLPSGAMLPPQAALRIVPPPQRTWRHMIGRMLIRAGQRMIMENRV